MRNDEGGVELVYPECEYALKKLRLLLCSLEADCCSLVSGNRLYQSLGNLRVNPAIGIAIPDYDTADVLYLTGRATILVGEAASSLIARTQLAVKVTVSAARFVRAGLPFRGAQGEYSPYNPPVRQLLSEKNDPRSGDPVASQSDMTAVMVRREVLTPTMRDLRSGCPRREGRRSRRGRPGSTSRFRSRASWALGTHTCATKIRRA